MTVARTTNGRRVRWDDMPREQLMAGVQRKFLWGEKAMIAQIWLAKGTVVPKHVHVAEQLSYIVEGALRLKLGDTGEEVHELRAGEVLVIPANVPHEAVALEDTYDLDVFSPPREDWIKGQDAYLRGR
jgi:quercetin dioxygenase-like cupin family protein